jgi:hypothetical protein
MKYKFSILVLIIIIVCACLFKNPLYENIDNKQIDIEIVISRYNENLKWLNDEKFLKYPIVCYNKGVNDDFFQPPNMRIEKLQNKGRCDHTYLYHIVNNYDNLAENTLFFPGSCNLPHKIDKINRLLKEFEEYKNTVFLGNYYEDGVKETLYNFSRDYYSSEDAKNLSLNNDTKLEPAKIRPFGKWYEKHFGDLFIQYVSFYGIFGVNRKHIIQHPKSYYENLLNEFTDSSNPEVGHYFERSWVAMFSPMPDAKFIEYVNGPQDINTYYKL